MPSVNSASNSGKRNALTSPSKCWSFQKEGHFIRKFAKDVAGIGSNNGGGGVASLVGLSSRISSGIIKRISSEIAVILAVEQLYTLEEL